MIHEWCGLQSLPVNLHFPQEVLQVIPKQTKNPEQNTVTYRKLTRSLI